jgi:hypothetical protein
MKAEELRIGNYVKINNIEFHPRLQNRILKVSGINKCVGVVDKTYSNYSINLEHIMQNENYYYDTYSQFLNFVEPIELTKELLVRLGFKPFSKDFQKNNIIIHTRKRGFVINTKIPIIKYVHQLQNIYHYYTLYVL